MNIFQHFRQHWHHHLSLIGLLLAGVLLGAGSASAYTRWHGHGFVPGPLPRELHIGGAARLPSSWWLNRYLTRTHNQGNSNSCVGHTLATLEEITQRERSGLHPRYSAGYIWNQVNGGQNVGVTYDAAFRVLTGQGDAHLKDFPYDGTTGYWILPGPKVIQKAGPYRFASWRSIAPGDRRTVEYELAHGRPLAVAMPIYSSTYNHWQTRSWITGSSGSFLFWHSMTVIGYNPWGVEIQNSWGPQWGDAGHSMWTWNALVNSGAELVVATPRAPLSGHRPPQFGPKTIIRAPRP